ncbi:hypothetical protein ACHWQZ_G005841 [Mnemiopsis leidyi]
MIRIIDEELREACAIGDETKAQMLIGQGANVNSSNKVNGWTALHWAAYRGHRGLVMFLLNKGADPTIQNSKGETVTSLLSNYSLDLLEGKEVDDAKQYPLPSQQETLNSLPIMPNYIRNPEFPYSTKKDPLPMMNSGPPPNHIVTPGTSLNQKQSGVHKGPGVGPPGVGPSGPSQTARPILVQVPSSQGNRSNSSSPQLPSSTNNMSKQNCSTERMDMETDTRQGNLAPSMLASTSSSPKTSTRYQLPHSKPSPNWTFPGPSHRPSMITAQPLFPTQMRPGQMQLGPGHPQLVPGPGPHRYPVSSIPVSSEYPIQRIMRPGYAPPAVSIPSGYGAPPASVGPPPGYGGPSGAGGAAPGSMGVVPPGNMVHWGFNTPSHFRPQAGMVPQSIQPAASQSPNPPLPTSPQVVNIPDSTQDKEMTTPVKDSPVCSPSANSANSSPSADATIKVRLAGSEDFFEVELSDIGDTYASLVKCLAEELDVKSETVSKIRKLPNILIRKDRDVKRIKSGSEFEVELNAEN